MNETTIPKKEQANALYMLWVLTTTLESRIQDHKKEALDAITVAGGYSILNRLGYTPHRPRWEKFTAAAYLDNK